MIPYLIGLVGSYLIGESMQSESFDEGGPISMHNRIQEYQIKKSDGTYFYLKMSTGSPAWSKSPDMAYLYTERDAEKIKDELEKEGVTGLSIVKYDKDWWKNAKDEFAKGGKTESYLGSYKKPIKTIEVVNFLNSTKSDDHKYSLWNKGVGITFAYNGKLYENNGQTLPKGTVISLDKIMDFWNKKNCDTLLLDDEGIVILPEKQDKYNCYTTGYDGMRNQYGNEDDLTLEEAVDFCWYYTDVKRKYAKKEDLEKEIKSTPYGETNVIASSGNIMGVVVYKLSTQNYAKGGKLKKKYAVLRSPMGEIIADIEVENEDKMDALKKFRDMGINEVGTIYFTETPPHYYAKGGVIGDAARVKSKNKTGVIMKIFKPDDFEQFSDIKAEKNYLIKFADGTQDTYSQSKLEIFKN